MKDCLFCKIVRDELPAIKVYEDDLFIGFMDIFPKAKGHTLVIPKEHHRWVYDVPQFEAYWGAARKITTAIQKGLGPKWISYFTYGAVPHAHIHILPRNENPDTLTESAALIPSPVTVTKEEIAELAEKIKASF